MQMASARPGRRVITLWKWNLDLSAQSVAAFWQVLSPDEREQANRRATVQLRDRAIAARGGLRHALSRYIHRPPAALRFVYGRHGKPMLADAMSLQFNLSHSGALALLGIDHEIEIGVDVERIVAMPAELLALLAPAERRWLASLPPRDQATAFFDCWTRKEAYVKATGLGLSIPFDSFDVLSDPGSLRTQQGAACAGCEPWRIASVLPADGYIGAVASTGAFSLELHSLF